MNAIVFSFTRNGAKISLKLQKYLDSCGFATEIFTTRRYRDLDPALKEIAPSLQLMCKEAFSLCRLMVFIGATGIAIRSIAPYIRSKTKDPAVISIDEQESLSSRCFRVILAARMGWRRGLLLF